MYPRRKRQRSDEALFLAYRDEQDCQALNDLFRRRVDELLRLAVFLAARPTDAEDLVQATFLTAISKAESFHEGGRVMSWLCGILTNHARMLRRAERESGGEPRDEPIAPSDPANDALRVELRATLGNGIAGLKEPYRSVLQLYFREGLGSKEISERLSRSPATVRKQMERGIDRLRTLLPLGIASTLLVRVDAAQLADRAAEAARFVDPVALPASTAPGPLLAHAGILTLLGAGLALTAALLFYDPDQAAPTPTGIEASPVAPVTVSLVTELSTEPLPQPIEPTVSRVAAGRPNSLHVLTVDMHGKPRADVPLLLVRVSGRTLPERITAGDAQQATTDASGVALFTPVAAGGYELAQPGEPSRAGIAIKRGDNSIRLVLPAPVRFSGQVVDHQGYPVADATIVVSATARRGDAGCVVATTDRAGRFVASSNVVTGRVFAIHPDHGSSNGVVIGAAAAVELTMRPNPGRVRVHVCDHDGAALSGAYVALAPRGTANTRPLSQHAKTDREGNCEFAAPGGVPCSIVTSHPGFAPSIRSLDDGTTTATIRLGRGASIRGRALDPDGRPLVGNLVYASRIARRSHEPAGHLIQRRARVAADGSFAFAQLPVGQMAFRIGGVQDAAQLQPFMNQHILARASAELHEGEQLDLLLTAVPHGRLTGSIRTPSHRPLGGWHVVALPRQGIAPHRMLRSRTARSRADGTFSIPGVRPDHDYDLGVYPPDAKAIERAVYPAVTALARSGNPTEVIVDPSDPPKHTLSFRLLQPDGSAATQSRPELRRLDFQISETRRLASDGSCRFVHLAPGDYWLVVGTAATGMKTLAIHLDPDQPDLDLGAIQLEEPTRLEIRLHAEDGPLPKQARVKLGLLLGDKAVRRRTDALGRATLPRLSPGTAELLIRGPGIIPVRRQLELRSGRPVLDIAVKQAPAVSVRFTFDPVDNPFLINGPLAVELHRADGTLVFRDSVGAATLPGVLELVTGLPPGHYTAQATSLWDATATLDFEVTEDGDNIFYAPLGYPSR